MLRSLLLTVILLSIAAPFLSAQTLFGSWQSKAQGLELTLDRQGRFLLRSPSMGLQGRWGAQGAILTLQASTGQLARYQVRFLTDRALGLVDGQGNVYNYLRPSVPGASPATSTRRPKTRDGAGREFETRVGILQFVIGRPLSRPERMAVESDLRRLRREKGPSLTGETADLAKSLEKIRSLRDPAQVCLLRQSLLSSLHAAARSIPAPRRDAFARIVMKGVEILARCPKTNLVLTRCDLDGLVAYYEFCNEALEATLSMASPVPEGARERFRKALVAAFPELPEEKKRFAASASLIWANMQLAWRAMDEGRRKVVQAGMACRFPDPAPSATGPSSSPSATASPSELSKMRREHLARQNMFRMMQNSSLGNHAMMLNTIENFGNTGVEWKVEPAYGY